MSVSLRQRVAFSFNLATLVTVVLSISVYYHLAVMHDKLANFEKIESSQNITLADVRAQVLTILADQREIFFQKSHVSKEEISKLSQKTINLKLELEKLEKIYPMQEVKLIISQMKGNVESLSAVLTTKDNFSRRGFFSNTKTVFKITDHILENMSEIFQILSKESSRRKDILKKIINDTKKNMMITLIIGFLATIILGLVLPGQIALPFKKIKDTIRELRECNFDVSIYYDQDDEIGEIAQEMNEMIKSFKRFEELKADRISLENRRFDALANLVKRPVLVADAEGKIKYMNNRMYNLLQVQSEDVIGKEMNSQLIPPSIIASIELAIKRRSKIENEEVVITKKKEVEVVTSESSIALLDEEKAVDTDGKVEKIAEKEEEKVEIVYKGFANIIPIRGKSSSLDYYLMVLSTEVFA